MAKSWPRNGGALSSKHLLSEMNTLVRCCVCGSPSQTGAFHELGATDEVFSLILKQIYKGEYSPPRKRSWRTSAH